MSKPFRLTGKSQVTVPKDVRNALGVGPGDAVSYEIEGEKVVLRRSEPQDVEARIAAFSQRVRRAIEISRPIPLGMTVDAYMALIREPVPVPDPDDLR